MTTATIHGPGEPASAPAPASAGRRGTVSTLRLAGVHAKYSIIEQFRIPMAWIGGTLFPVLAFCFFVLPMKEVRENSLYATEAMLSMLVFAFLANGLFAFGMDLASQRAKPWAPYLRTLPGTPSARIIGLIASTLVSAILAGIPVLAVALLFTQARPAPGALALSLLAVVVTSVPAALIGLIIGTTCSEKAAIAAAQLSMFTLAFASGLFMPPMMFPEWLEVATRVLPTRAARDLCIALATGGQVEWWMIASLVGWTIALAAVGIWLFRRDEGRRYR